MKQATYSDEQIIEAGMQLLAENKRVTPFGIRNIIGGGNPQRIKAIWEASQKDAIEGQIVVDQVELPTEFEDSLEVTKTGLDELAKRLYARAQEIAESRVRETIAAAKKAKETAEAEVSEAMDAVNELDHEKETLQTQLEESRTKLRDQTSENVRLQERLETLSQKAKKQQQELKKKDQLKKQVIELQVKNELAEKQLAEKTQEAKKASKEAATLKGKLEVFENQATKKK